MQQGEEKDRASTADAPAPDTTPSGDKLTYEGPDTPMDRSEAEALFPKGAPSDNHRGSLGQMAARVLNTPSTPQVQPTQVAPPQATTPEKQQAPQLAGSKDLVMNRSDPSALARGERAIRQKDATGSLAHSIGEIIKIIASMGAGAAAAGGGAGAGGTAGAEAAGGYGGSSLASGATGYDASAAPATAAPAASSGGGGGGIMNMLGNQGGGGGGGGGGGMGNMMNMGGGQDMMNKPSQNVQGISDLISADKNAKAGAAALYAESLAHTNGNRWGFPS